MELIITIISAIAAVVAAVYAVRNDKAHIRKRIRKKEEKINKLESQIFIKYHNKLGGGSTSPEQKQINKLKQEISDLEDRL
jgi:cell division protein FtsL